MADPRINIVKPCPPAYLGASAAEIGSSTASRNTFFNAAGKVGDLQVLNSVGAGKIGQGLRTLSSISNTIRQGCGSLPTSIGGTLSSVTGAVNDAFTAGGDWVLGHMGMGINTVEAVRAFHPEIANQALGQAKAVYERVKQGKFKAADIPSYLQDFQNLERLGRNIFTPGAGDRQARLQPQCEASPYAIDLIARQPKHKFMFVVQFVPNEEYLEFAGIDPAFTVTESSRPSMQYQMEDINFYNFRSKIITKTTFDPMSMRFYDDIRGQVGAFYSAYMKSLSPVTNYPERNMFNHPEEDGMSFSNAPMEYNVGVERTSSATYSASSASPGDNKSIFREIVLYHLFDGGRLMDVYRFYNPRITEMKPEGLTMKESAALELELGFVYDAVYVASNETLPTSSYTAGVESSANPHNTAFYPLRYISGPGGMNAPNDKSTVSPYGDNNSPVNASSCSTNVNTNLPNK